MKYIKSKCIKKSVRRDEGKYLITLEVSDNDINMIEDLATTYSGFQLWEDYKSNKITFDKFNRVSKYCEFNKKYGKWLIKTWRQFCKLWHKYD